MADNSPDRMDRISIFAHPYLPIVVSTFGVIGIVLSYQSGTSWRENLSSLLLGFSLGMPAVLIEKWVMWRNTEFYAEFFVTDIPSRFGWHLQKRNLLCCLPFVVFVSAWPIATRLLHQSELPGVWMASVLCVLLYPEQKTIYAAAQAMIDAVNELNE